MGVDEDRAELGQVEADAAARVDKAKNKAAALIGAAKAEATTANRRAEEAVKAASMAIDGAKKKARMAIEVQLSKELDRFKTERSQVERKSQDQMDDIDVDLSASEIHQQEESITASKKKVLADLDARVAHAKKLAQTEQDQFCNRMDQHLSALQKVATLTAAKMSARLSKAHRQAKKIVADKHKESKQELLEASKELDGAEQKKQQLADAAEHAAEVLKHAKANVASVEKVAKNKMALAEPRKLMEEKLAKAKTLVEAMEHKAREQQARVEEVESTFEQAEHGGFAANEKCLDLV